jgi:hypothetical protein
VAFAVVLAAAVASDAQAIVTLNLRHFPDEACEPFAVEPLHPDEFLLNLLAATVPNFAEALR